MEHKQIAVLIPCYNEEKTIPDVVADFKEHLPEAEIYVYDNNSSDRTSELALAAGAIVKQEPIQGKGNVIRRMFREVDADCYVMIDGDNTYPARKAREMVDKVLDHGADMVVGDRLSSTYFEENKRLFHNSGNKLVRKLINTLYGNKIRDVMTGYRAMSYQFVKTFPVLTKGFEIETEMTMHALDKKMHIENVIIDYRDRPDGSQSKLNTYSDGVRVLLTILRLFKDYMPLAFFSLCGGLVFAVSLFFFLPVLFEFFQTGLVARFPTLIVSAALMAIASQFVFCGLILDTIAKQARQRFELDLIKLKPRG